jgi:thymidylate synthase (FAD)
LEVQLIDKMGSDLTVVNAARVSYAKESEWESVTPAGPVPGVIKEKDEKLIGFLAKHNHWSPFAHCSLQFRIKAPIFVARQLVKHQVGLSWNEVSRRYVDFPPELYKPESWRGRPIDSKQGSDGTVELGQTIDHNLETTMESCLILYHTLIEKGVAPEQARMVLPQSMITEWYWSGSLYAFARVCNLRCAKDTQKETRDIADKINKICEELFPYSWKHLRNQNKEVIIS